MKRAFECDGVQWVAWTSGESAYGTGTQGLGSVEAIHFAHTEAPEVPLLEALMGTVGLDTLFDDEVLELFRSARRVVDPSEGSQRPVSRRGAGLS